MKTLCPILRLPRGFSLAELILTITLVGVLASLLVTVTANRTIQVSEAKLEADVRQLNQMVSLYRADGGTLNNLTRVRDVLSRLKNSRAENTIRSHTGPVSGRLLDARIEPMIQSGSAGRKRAIWSAAAQRFLVVSDGREGVFSFEIDASKAAQGGQAENRQNAAVRFDGTKESSWIWGSPVADQPIPYQQTTESVSVGTSQWFDPTAPNPLAAPADPGGGGGDPGGEPGGGDPGGGVDPGIVAQALPPPLVIPSGGTYPFDSFPSSVMVTSNGAPAGDSEIQIRINEGGWSVHTGGGIAIQPGDTLEAQNRPTDGVDLYTASMVTTDTYDRLVSGFNGTSSATFTNPEGGAGLFTETDTGPDGELIFRHGSSIELDLGGGEMVEYGTPSVLTFQANAIQSVAPNNWFSMGGLTAFNGETFNSSDANSVTLTLALNLTNPAHSGQAEIVFDLINTPQTGNRLADADIVQIRQPVTDFVITVDGIQYRLELGWSQVDPTAGSVDGSKLLVFEGATANLQLRGRFVSDR